MTNQNLTIVAVAILFVIGIGYIATKPQTEPAPASVTVTSVEEKIITLNEESLVNETEPTESAVRASETAVGAMATNNTPGTYQSYDKDTIAASKADKILLFFHASWCPSCRALDADIVANADSIPSGVEIYKLDYDTETTLKQQYGIVRQHSIIQINADGTAVSSVSHPLTAADLLASL